MSVRRIVLMATALAIAAFASSGRGGSQYADEFQLTAAAAAPAREARQVGYQAFHDRLAPYGQWMNDPRWGMVWHPKIRRGFWPYRQGHWLMTTEYGTVWVSDYPWGDIPFHYGRWFYDPERGWLWVPGYVWGPSWVIWRAGEGKVGWMPMPPWIAYDGNGAFPDDWSDWYGYRNYGYSASRFYALWCFVDASDLYAPSVDYFVIGPGFNVRFIDRTAGWTRYGLYHDHVFNPSIEQARFRATFGFPMRAPKRSDFEHRLGPITDYGAGRQIETRERSMIGRPLSAARALVPPPAAARLGSPGAPIHATSQAPAVRAPVAHPAATKSETPRVYTYTEVVPYHPESPTPPVKTVPAKAPRAGPPKGSSGNPPH